MANKNDKFQNFPFGIQIITALGIVFLSCQGNMSTISGKVVGADGQPVPQAIVQLAGATGGQGSISLVSDPVLVSEAVQKDGTFRISTRETGPFVLLFKGVGHKQLRLSLPIAKHTDLAVDVRLARALPDTAQAEILILTSIDGGATLQRASLLKQASGAFRVDIPTMGDSLTYTVWAGGPDSWAGTLIGATAQRYELTSMGDFAAVVPVTDGHAIIEYRASSHEGDAPGSYRFLDSTSTPAAFEGLQRTFAKYVRTSDASLQNHLRSGKSFSSFSYPWIDIADTLARAARMVRDGLLKDELALEVLECYERAHVSINDRSRRQLIAGVDPTSLAWVYHGSLGLATRRIPDMGDTYFASIVDQHPWRSYAAYLLYCQCVSASQVHDSSTVMAGLTRLAKEFENVPGARLAQATFAPNDIIRVGSSLPEFAFRSSDDSTVVFTNATFRGAHLLMIFWSTSCSPCVAEMPLLHQINEKYAKAGLKVFSVSLGNEPTQVSRFRKWRWPMPWSVAVVPMDRVPSVSRHFAAGTPTHILVDPAGKILMIDSLLYGNHLDTTLARFLKHNEPRTQ